MAPAHGQPCRRLLSQRSFRKRGSAPRMSIGRQATSDTKPLRIYFLGVAKQTLQQRRQSSSKRRRHMFCQNKRLSKRSSWSINQPTMCPRSRRWRIVPTFLPPSPNIRPTIALIALRNKVTLIFSAPHFSRSRPKFHPSGWKDT